MILAFSSTKKNKEKKKKVTPHSWLHVLGTMIMSINQPCWDYTPISLEKKFENHVNVVPNAWLTRKMMVPRASHINLIISFAMHSISMPESFISMRCRPSIGDQN